MAGPGAALPSEWDPLPRAESYAAGRAAGGPFVAPAPAGPRAPCGEASPAWETFCYLTAQRAHTSRGEEVKLELEEKE